MRGKFWVIGAVSAVSLIAAIYFGVHSPRPRVDSPDQSARAKPAATAVADSTTVARAPGQASVVADQTNPSGSSFRELRQCVYAARDLVAAKHLTDCRFYEGKPQYQDALAECLNGPMNARNRITAAEAALSQCDQADMGTRYFAATKQAAKSGNADAQLCYLQGDFFSPEGAQIFTDAEIEEYKKVAPGYVDAALKRGDWRIVHLLNTRHFHPGSGPLRLLERIGERDTRYKMTKLLRLGSSGSYAEFMQSRLEGMLHPDLNPSAALPPEVAKEGDEWAQQTYIDYFSGSLASPKRPWSAVLIAEPHQNT